jgi:transketolase
MDVKKVQSLAGQYRYIFSIEEHSILGGLGTALSEVIAEMEGASRTATLVRLGVRDAFGESGTAEELLKKHGLDPEGIVRSVQRILENQRIV